MEVPDLDDKQKITTFQQVSIKPLSAPVAESVTNKLSALARQVMLESTESSLLTQ